jgi:hypothetical protein
MDVSLPKDEWIDRCVARYMSKSSIDLDSAKVFAEACWDMREGWFENAPEDAADSDMSYWEPY